MADNKVNFLRGTSAEYEAKTKDNDTFYYTTDTKKLYLGENEIGNGIDPKVIQAHIDNQTIHAKVWKGTQEEYNAIEPKEDDTIYIIKDSDNTLADKLIDDTSTTATDKTWSAKKINENDEVARAALNAHEGNADIHVTAEEKASWNAVNYSNPNLLTNPSFSINQRGLSSYPAGQYTVDCWKSIDISTEVTSGGVKLTVVDNSSLAEFVQKLEFPYEALAGRTVAVSAIINGEYVHAAETVPATKPDKTTHLVYTSGDWQFGLSWSVGGNFYVRFVGADGTADISSAKLEIGSTATAFIPPIYSAELLKCQRYLHKYSDGTIGTGYAISDTQAVVFLPLKTTPRGLSGISMELNGTLSLSTVTHSGSNSLNCTSVTYNKTSTSYCKVVCTAAGLTAGEPVEAQIRTAGDMLLISNEL